MPKPYDDRFQAMLRPGARAADVEALIAETGELIDAAGAAAENARSTARSPESSEAAAAAARDAAGSHEFAVERLQAKREKLEQRLEELKSSEQAKASAELYRAAAARNAELATEIRDRAPGLLQELADLAARIEANDAEIEEANLARPGGAPGLLSAEYVARDTGGHRWKPGGVVPVDRLTKLKLPRFDGPGFLWPVDRRSAELGRVMELEDRRRDAERRSNSPEARAERAAAAAAEKAREDAKFSRYRVHNPRNALIWDIENRRGSGCLDAHQEFTVEMNADQIEAARARGLTVEPVAIDEKTA